MNVHDIDEHLMLKVKKGDVKAFETLVERYQKSLYNFALRMLGSEEDASDMTQEIFLRVYKSAPNYEVKAKFATWIFRIAKNLCLNFIRDKKNTPLPSNFDNETEFEIPDSNITNNPLRTVEAKEMSRRVAQAVHKLPESLKITVILCKYHEMPYEEAAEIMGCTVNALKIRIHRARKLLAEYLNSDSI
jgi:RNA polymerase sigma-70 factor (ECF subfamily)